MNKNSTVTIANKWVKGALMMLLVAVIALPSCTKVEIIEPQIPVIPIDPDDPDVFVTFQVKVPKPEIPTTYALNADDENAIKSVEILLFDKATQKFIGKPYYCDKIENVGSAQKKFTIKLPKGGPYDIVVLANSRAAVVATPPVAGATKDDVLKLLTMNVTGKWIAETTSSNYIAIPMWGELLDKTVVDNINLTTGLMRMVAAIDVSLDVTVQGDFELTKVHLVNANSKGHIAPASGNITGGVVTAPTLATGSTVLTPIEYAVADKKNLKGEIYTFEGTKAVSGSMAVATCVVLEGKYKDGNVYFYRVDIGIKKDGVVTYHHILRNVKYDIKITKISGTGSGSLEQAIKHPGLNVESNIIVWDKNELPIIVYNDQYALGFSSDDITLGYAAGASKPLKVMTDFTGGWKIDKIVDADETTPTTWLTVSPMASTVGQETSMEEVEFTVTENKEATPRVCWVYVSAGALRHKVKVTQRPVSKIIKTIVWEDYDGVTGVTTNDDGTTDNNFTKITVVDSGGSTNTSVSITAGVVDPTLDFDGDITNIVVTYKGYEMEVPASKYSYDVLTKTLTITDRSLIGKAVHLDKIRLQEENSKIVGDYIQVSDVNLLGYTNLAGETNNWVPIGIPSIPFVGTYTGGYSTKEFTISNLTIDRETEYYVGLFGFIGTGSTLNKIHIAPGGDIRGKEYVGGIVGWNNSGTISGCTNSATVTGTENYIGGICGWNNDGDSKITDCKNLTGGNISGGSFVGGISGYNSGAISGCTNAATVTGTTGMGDYVGGIVGYNEGTNSKITGCNNLTGGNVSGVLRVGGICGGSSRAAISGCTNAATVTGTTGTIGKGDSVGGICGGNYLGTISGCTNNGTVTGIYDAAVLGSGDRVGGICGYNNGIISDCTNSATVSGTSFVGGICGDSNGTISGCTNSAAVAGTGAKVGGIVGHNVGTISGCTNEATVTGIYDAAVVGSGEKVGGICGSNNSSTISDCTNDSAVTARNYVGGIVGYNEGTNSKLTDCKNLAGGNVSGVSRVGGICGTNGDDTTTPIVSGGKISGCTNDGTVTGTGEYVGGICGGNYLGTISGCTNNGTVTGIYDAAVLGSGDRVGGIVGWNNSGTISGCTNSATVSGTSYIGGIVGYSYGIDSEITNCTNSAAVIGTESSVGGIVGHNEGTNSKITDCKNLAGGNVSGKDSVGGICGLNYLGTISGCTNEATVTGIYDAAVVGSGEKVGGICGNNTGTDSNITDCENLVGGNVSGVSRVGGIVGYNFAAGSEITNCTNSAAVKGTRNYVGGIVGWNNGVDSEITNCTNFGTVTGTGYSVAGICGNNYLGTISACTNNGTVEGNSFRVGGIVGQNDNGSIEICTNDGAVTGTSSIGGICGNNNGTISACTNAATVTVTGTGTGKFVGGICGENYNTISQIYACINTASAAVSGADQVGGICGSAIGGVTSACYNLASVTGTGTNVGPVVGKADKLPTNCYFGGNANNFASDPTNGSTKFGSGAWPNVGMEYWSEYSATNLTGYWLSIGTWGNGTTTLKYPQLYVKPATP